MASLSTRDRLPGDIETLGRVIVATGYVTAVSYALTRPDGVPVVLIGALGLFPAAAPPASSRQHPRIWGTLDLGR